MAHRSALVDQLRLLGLTSSESKTHLAVVKSAHAPQSKCHANHSSKEQNIREIYSLMSRLGSEVPVEENADGPKQYGALNPRCALNFLEMVASSEARIREPSEMMAHKSRTKVI